MNIAARLKEEQIFLKNKVLELMLSKGVTRKNLVEIYGFNERTVRRIEKGETNLEFKTILMLAISFKIEIAYLFDYKNKLNRKQIIGNQQDFNARISIEKENLGIRILKLCKHRGIDQEELGILSRIESSEISLYIAGKENLVLLTLLKIAIGLEVEIVDLFDYDGPMPGNSFIGKLQF